MPHSKTNPPSRASVTIMRRGAITGDRAATRAQSAILADLCGPAGDRPPDAADGSVRARAGPSERGRTGVGVDRPPRARSGPPMSAARWWARSSEVPAHHSPDHGGASAERILRVPVTSGPGLAHPTDDPWKPASGAARGDRDPRSSARSAPPGPLWRRSRDRCRPRRRLGQLPDGASSGRRVAQRSRCAGGRRAPGRWPGAAPPRVRRGDGRGPVRAPGGGPWPPGHRRAVGSAPAPGGLRYAGPDRAGSERDAGSRRSRCARSWWPGRARTRPGGGG